MSAAQTKLQQALAPGSLICLDTNCLVYYFQGDMPWAENLRPVFEAKDGGTVKLLTSSLTLAELLARAESTEKESQILSAVRQYFDLIPVDDNIGINAAGIRRASNPDRKAKPPVKTPDAIEMATANETRSLIFITNDEQLTRMPENVRALYLKDLALDWLEDEFEACLATNASVSLASGVSTLSLPLRFTGDADLTELEPPISPEAFVKAALQLGELIAGPSAVIGFAMGTAGNDKVHALRVLPCGRPWIKPTLPDWLGQFTNIGKKHAWDEPNQRRLVTHASRMITINNEAYAAVQQPPAEPATPFIVVNVSRLAAENEVYTPGNKNMAEHRKRQDVWRRYLAPFVPVLPLLELDGARLWRGEAQNAHVLNLPRFLNFFKCAENVMDRASR